MNHFRPEAHLESLIEGLYVSALHPAHWTSTLDLLRRVTGSREAIYQVLEFDADLRRSTLFFGSSGLDEEIVHEYALWESWVGDPRTAHGTDRPVGITFQDHDFISRAEMRKHPFYEEYLASQDLRFMAGVPSRHEYRDGLLYIPGFGLQRSNSQGPLEGEDLAAWNVLLEHLLRSASIAFKLHPAVATPERHDSLRLSLWHLDSTGRKLNTGRDVDVLQFDRLVNTDISGRLRFVDNADQKRFTESLSMLGAKDTSKRTDGFISRNHSWRCDVFSIPTVELPSTVPAGTRFGVVISRSSRPQRSQLTPTENVLIEMLANGASLREIAEQRNVGYETVRSHVKHAMNKYGVHSQLELVLKWTGRTRL